MRGPDTPRAPRGELCLAAGLCIIPTTCFLFFFPPEMPRQNQDRWQSQWCLFLFSSSFFKQPFYRERGKKKEQFPRSLWLHGDAPARLRLPLGFVLLTLVGSARGAWLPALSPPLPPAVPGRGPRLGDVWGEEGSGVLAVQRGSFIPVPAPGLPPRPAASSVPPASPSCCSGSRRI